MTKSAEEIKEYHKNYNKLWYAANKQRINERRARNKDKIRQHAKDYMMIPENAERTKAYQKAYRSKPENQAIKKEYQKRYHQEYIADPVNKARIEEYNRISRAKPETKLYHKEYAKLWAIKKYGKTKEWYNEEITKGCAICGTYNWGKCGPNIDHNHACCNANYGCPTCLRGILCGNCNRMLGLARENIDILRNSINYLTQERQISESTGNRLINEDVKIYRRVHQHGVTTRWYNEQIVKGCSVCGTYNWEKLGPVIDHDHTCCKGGYGCAKCVRGVLCGRCNKMLGTAFDNVPTIIEAINYIDKFAVIHR